MSKSVGLVIRDDLNASTRVWMQEELAAGHSLVIRRVTADTETRRDITHKAALWDSIGEPALALLRQLVPWIEDGFVQAEEQRISAEQMAALIRALLDRAEEQQP